MRAHRMALATGAAGVVIAARALNRRRRRIGFGDKVAVIAGGSRGLGLVLARELAAEGAEIALVARTADDLERARAELREATGRDVMVFAVDVARPGAMDEVVEQVVERHGRIDLLINAAGTMLVAPVEHLDADDYARNMATHFWGPLHAMNAVVPVMRRQGGGRIVNISSIGGRIAVPHLVPYCASKFALSGLSEGLAAELAKDGIRVTTVCPSLMRTGSYVNIHLKGRHEKEFTWFALGASMPVVSMNARRAARRILDACRHGDRTLNLGLISKIAVAAHALAPNLVVDLAAAAARLLPAPAGPEGDEEQSGWSSRSARVPRRVTAAGHRAIERNNQLRGRSPAELSASR